jgi:UDP-N-acetylmuramoyl-L-alanyl-D-glutamate--2,6-diaminopimelate ligase
MARDLELAPTGSRFILVTPTGESPAEIRIPGRFNVANALAAAAAVQGVIGCTAVEIAQVLPELRPVPGRMSVVLDSPFSVVVDYAHTPGSFEHVLPFFREQTSGRLIVVFGSAGERDVAKRPAQGALADRYADVIVLADEDPRGEEPRHILEEIAAGIHAHREGDTLFLIPDRREAIRRAISVAVPGDTVLLLGKGHEASIISAVRTIPWNEREVAQEELSALGLI